MVSVSSLMVFTCSTKVVSVWGACFRMEEALDRSEISAWVSDSRLEATLRSMCWFTFLGMFDS